MSCNEITSLTVGEDTIALYNGRTSNYEKCVVAYFQGPDGWGVTMNIRPEELDGFVSNQFWQSAFIAFAKKKLGVEAA
ncbi:TPA: hypothetical protein RQK07_003321 [Vibrio vulnificus]|uniref:hypothetical protein n=1 Tax=Vibrio vulnificus TaxID=672 RepID=UPI0015FA87B5|nr:hypothetical protein [Vibrio vulnificus]MCA0763558.1 hypothetical protein [Vibrio vulnificus]QMV36568.1 hypothetical protein F6X00_09010 [Vibrio vulnificus]HAT8540532.1 hypothetical protein [Vibrio vulnificus]HDY7638925.1 hypothetical protein [Vibrio vulnificus]HDY7689416.1 hypothetical protein [Vibrio vulnificus]